MQAMQRGKGHMDDVERGGHGVGNGVDRGRVDVVVDAKGLLPVPVCFPLLCCLRVTISIAIAIVGLRSGCSCCCCCGVPVALGGKDVMVTNMLIENVLMLLMLLMLIKDCLG